MEVEYHFFSLLLLINDGIQSSHKFSLSPMPQLYHFWLWFVYKQYPTVSQAVLESFGVKFIPNCHKPSPNIYGFCLHRGMVMGYCSCMGYKVFFPAKQLCGLINLWDLREYGVCDPWVMRKSTVYLTTCIKWLFCACYRLTHSSTSQVGSSSANCPYP